MNIKKIISIGLATVMTLQTVAFANESAFSSISEKTIVKHKEELTVLPVKEKNYHVEKTVENEMKEADSSLSIRTQRKRINPKTDKYEMANPADDEVRVIATYKTDNGKNKITTMNTGSASIKKHSIGQKHTVMNVGRNALEELLKDKESYVIENDFLVFKNSTNNLTASNFSIEELVGNNYPSSVDETEISKYHDNGVYGSDVKIAILDTGLNVKSSELNICGGATFVDGSDSFADDNGHGTAMAGIVGALMDDRGLTGIAPNVDLYSVKVLDSNGIGRTSGVINGIYWAIENDMDIVYFGFATEEYSYALETAVADAYNNGVLMIAPAGNSNSSVSQYPAKYEKVISVGSVDADGTLSDFSNYGSTVDMYAPGNEIDTILYFNNKPTHVSGTSASAAHVAGYAALVIEEHKDDTNFDVYDYIVSNSEDELMISSIIPAEELDVEIMVAEETTSLENFATETLANVSVECILENNDSELDLLVAYPEPNTQGESLWSPIEIDNYGINYGEYVAYSGEKVYFYHEITSMMQVISFNLDSPPEDTYKIYYMDSYSGLDIDVTNEQKLLHEGGHYFYVTGKTSNDYTSLEPFYVSLDSLSVTNIEETYYDGAGVYAATGNYSKTFTDISTVVGGSEFSIKRHYNSKNENTDNDVLTFSRGWTLNYESNVTYKELKYWMVNPYGEDYEHVEVSKNQLSVITPEGKALYFTILMNDDSLSFIPINSRAEMDSNEDLSTTITVTLPDKTTYYYAPLKYTSSTIDDLKSYPKGYLYKVKDKYGNTTEIEYNSNDRIMSIEDPIGNVYSFTYDDSGNLTKISDAYGREATYEYDGSRLSKSTDAGGITYFYSYSGGYLSEIENANHATVNAVTYDSFNDEDSVFVDLEERIATLTDEYGTTYEYDYDLINNKTIVTEIPLEEGDNCRETTTFYDEEKKVTTFIDADSKTETIKYYTQNFYDYVTDYDGEYVEDNEGNYIYRYYVECDNGQILERVDKSGLKTTYSYSDNGNGLPKSKKVTSPTGTILEYEEYTYNSRDDITLRKTWIEKNSDSDKGKYHATRYTYDGYFLTKEAKYLPILSSTSVPALNDTNLSKYAVTSYEYDTDNAIKGLVSKVVYPAQYTGATTDKGWVYEYDAKGNQIFVINPESTETNEIKDVYEYNDFGLVSKHISGEGVVMEYEYNNNLQETKKTVTTENGTEVTFTEYNNLGLPVQIVSPNEYNAAYEEDDGTYSDETVGVRYTYYDNGTLASETDSEGNSIQYEYDRFGNIQTKTMPNGLMYKYSYDDISNINLEYYRWNSKNYTVYDHDFSYESGNTVHQIGTLDDNNDETGDLTVVYNHFGKEVEYRDEYENGLERYRRLFYDLQGNLVNEYYIDNASHKHKETFYTNDSFDASEITTYEEKFASIDFMWVTGAERIFDIPDDATYKYERTDYDKNGNIVRTLVSTVAEENVPTLADANVITETSEYYADNLIKSKTDIYGVKTEYEYDKDRNLSKVTVTEPGKAPQIIAYTNSHNGKPETIKTYVDDENVTDSDNLLLDSLGTYTLTTNTYDKNGNLTKQVSSTGLTTEYTYNDNNLQTSVSSYETGNAFSAQSESVVYDFRGNITQQTDKNGNETKFVYNELGYLIYTIHPNGKITLTTRDKYGKLIAEVDAVDYDGDATAENATITTYETDKTNISEMNRTEYTYDQFDRIVKVTRHTYDPETETTTSVDRQTNTYDAYGNLIKTVDANGNTIGYEYDAFGNVTKYIEPSKYAPAEDFDEDEGEIRPYTTFYEYDMLGRKIKEGNSNGDYHAYTYDKKGNILSSAIVEDGESQTISTYTYDDGGRILTQTDGNGHTTTLVYDDNNRLMMQYAHGGEDDETKTDYYSYDILGNLTEHTTRNGDTIEYEYDVFNRLVKTTSEDGVVTYTYDNNGNILTMTDSTGTTEYVYDKMDRFVSKTHSETGTVSYEYDIYTGIPYGYVAEITTEPDEDTVEKWYDSEDKIVKVVDGTDITWYTYYDDGRLKSTTKPDGSVSTNTYDDEGNLLTLVTLDAAEDVLDSFTYVYDDNSIGYKNQISKTEIVAGENKGTTSYEYDIQGRLTKVTNPDGSTNEYTYDNAGNRLSKTTTSGETIVVTNYTYDEQNRLTQSVTGNATTYYGYDNNGNQISEWTRIANVSEATDGVSLGLQNETTDDLLTLYEYDAFDRLVKIEQGADVIENTYTADGKKLSRTTNGALTYYVYDGNVVIEEQNEDNDETARNVYGRNLVTRETSDGVVVYSYNGHSDVIAICNLDGDVLVTYTYDEFGNLTDENIVDEDYANFDNPYRYAGYEYIEEVKLYDLNARYYNPEIARFLSADPYYNLGNRVIGLYEINVPNAWSIIQANGLYIYCGNSPLIYFDWFGFSGEHIVLSGGDYSDDSVESGYDYNFIEPALKKINELRIEYPDEQITWIITNSGWNQEDWRAFISSVSDLNVNIIPVSTSTDLINYINYQSTAGLLFDGEGNTINGRFYDDDKIVSFTVFAHGAPNIVGLSFDYSEAMSETDLKLTTDMIYFIDPNAFKNPVSEFYTCNTATISNGTDFLSTWSNHIGGISIGYAEKTDYAYITYSKGYDFVESIKVRMMRAGFGFSKTGSLRYPDGTNGDTYKVVLKRRK